MKKALSVFLICMLMVSMMSCGNSTVSTSENLEQDTIETEEISENQEKTETEDELNIEEKNNEIPSDGLIKLAKKKDTTIEDICKFQIESVKLTNEVWPKNPGSYCSYYKAESGKVYVDMCIAYKNLEENSVCADELISSKVIYNNDYEYSGFATVEEDSRSDLTYANITDISPLSTEYIHYVYEVPKEVKNTKNPLVIELSVGGNDYKYIVR